MDSHLQLAIKSGRLPSSRKDAWTNNGAAKHIIYFGKYDRRKQQLLTGRAMRLTNAVGGRTGIRSCDRWSEAGAPRNSGSWRVPRQPEGAIDPQLNPADGQEADPGFGLAGFELVADSELPFPDPRRGGHGNRVFDTPVGHGKPPIAIHPSMMSTGAKFPLFNFARPLKKSEKNHATPREA
jgi:hypothetical protein